MMWNFLRSLFVAQRGFLQKKAKLVLEEKLNFFLRPILNPKLKAVTRRFRRLNGNFRILSWLFACMYILMKLEHGKNKSPFRAPK